MLIGTARFPARMDADFAWEETAIPLPAGGGGVRTDILSGRECKVSEADLDAADVFGSLPVAALVPDATPSAERRLD